MLLKLLQYNGGWGWTGRFCPLAEEETSGLKQGLVNAVQFCPERSLVGNAKYLKGTLITQPARLLTEKFNITFAQLLADWSPTQFNQAGVKFGRFRVIADRDLTPSRLKKANLLLVGTTEENRVTAGPAGKLPVRLNRDRVQMSGKQYSKSGLILV